MRVGQVHGEHAPERVLRRLCRLGHCGLRRPEDEAGGGGECLGSSAWLCSPHWQGGQDDTGSTNVASRSDVTLEEGDYETGHAEEYDAAHTVPHVNEYNPGSPSNTRTGADSNDNDSGDGDDDDDDGNRPSKRARIKRGTSPSPPPPRRATSRSTTAAPSPTDYGVPALLKPIADRLTAHAEEKAQWAIEREHLLSELVVARASLDVERAGFAAREAAWEAGEAAWKAEKEQYEAWRKDGLRFLQR